jgi:hypothetical protein
MTERNLKKLIVIILEINVIGNIIVNIRESGVLIYANIIALLLFFYTEKTNPSKTYRFIYIVIIIILISLGLTTFFTK